MKVNFNPGLDDSTASVKEVILLPLVSSVSSVSSVSPVSHILKVSDERVLKKSWNFLGNNLI